MLEYVYQWIQNLAVYLILVTAVMQVIPGKEYRKYVQFFAGMVLILLLLTPVMKLTGAEKGFYELYHSREYELQKREIERQADYLEDLDILEFLPEEYYVGGESSLSGEENAQENEKDETGSRIEVEEIQLGE